MAARWWGAILVVAWGLAACGGGGSDGGRTGTDGGSDLGGDVAADPGTDPGTDTLGKDGAAEAAPEVVPEATGGDTTPGPDGDLPDTASPDLTADPGPSPDGTPDVGIDAVADPGSSPDTTPACTPDPPVAADGARTVLVTHPFSEESGVCGRGLEVLRLQPDGTLETTGEVLEVGNCPTRVVFSPDGRLVLVLNNNNDPQVGDRSLVVLRHHADGSLEIVNELKELGLRAVEDVAFSLSGSRAYVTDNDVVGNGGVHVIDVSPGCDASYHGWIDLHHASAIAMLPGGQHAAVMAGPVWNDTKDLAFVDLETDTVAGQTANFSDFVSAYSLAAAPDGRSLVVPNASMFSELANTLTVMSLHTVNGVPVPSIQQVVEDVTEPNEVLYSPDGSMLLATTFSGDSVRWFHVDAQGELSSGGELTGIGLADRADMLRRGPLTGYVVVSSVTDVARLRFTATGLEKLAKLPLGDGAERICGDIAVEP